MFSQPLQRIEEREFLRNKGNLECNIASISFVLLLFASNSSRAPKDRQRLLVGEKRGCQGSAKRKITEPFFALPLPTITCPTSD
jgi:hypothetical protein